MKETNCVVERNREGIDPDENSEPMAQFSSIAEKINDFESESGGRRGIEKLK
jgi:hypothetical protein